MSTIESKADTTSLSRSTEQATQGRGIGFWIVRYLPAEIAGTAAMILAGLGVTFWTDNPAIIALAALAPVAAGVACPSRTSTTAGAHDAGDRPAVADDAGSTNDAGNFACRTP